VALERAAAMWDVDLPDGPPGSPMP
jgi:hypothetical protein